MKLTKFNDLYMWVDEKHSEEFAAALEAALPEGWRRDREGEEFSKPHALGGSGWFYYWRDGRGGREAVKVALYRRDPKTLYVCNIVPLDRCELTYEQYNRALEEFHDKVLCRVKLKFPIVFAITS